MKLATGDPDDLVRDMLDLWRRFDGSVRIILPTRYWADTSRYPNDPVVGESSVLACAWSVGLLTLLNTPWRAESSHRLEFSDDLTARERRLIEDKRENILAGHHLISLGGPQVNTVSEHFFRVFGRDPADFPLNCKQIRRQRRDGSSFWDFELTYQGRTYQPQYSSGTEGDPNRIESDYGFVVWKRIPGPFPQRWFVLTIGTRTFGMQAAMASLTTPACAAAIQRITGDEEFHYVVRIDHLGEEGEHPVRVLHGSHDEFAEGDEWFPNPDGPALSEYHLPHTPYDAFMQKAQRTEKPVRARLAPSGGPYPWSGDSADVIACNSRFVSVRSGQTRTPNTHRPLCQLVQADYAARSQMQAPRPGLMSSPGATPEYRSDTQWVDSHPDTLEGLAQQWIAVLEHNVIASAPSGLELMEEIERTWTGEGTPFITFYDPGGRGAR